MYIGGTGVVKVYGITNREEDLVVCKNVDRPDWDQLRHKYLVVCDSEGSKGMVKALYGCGVWLRYAVLEMG